MRRLYRWLLTIVCLGTGTIGAQQAITNFATAKTVFDLEIAGTTIWAATSGGLYTHDMATGAYSLRPASTSFPDPSIRALAFDGKGNLWVGSHAGYLMMRDGKGNESFNYSCVSADWRINDLVSYGKYLIIGSDKGVGLFDTEKKIVVKSAQHIGNYLSSQIYTVTTFKNRLYVGGESGGAFLKVPLDKIDEANFYDPSRWQTDTTVAPVRSFYRDKGGLKPSSVITGRYLGHLFTVDSNLIIIHSDEPDTIPMASAVTCIREINDKSFFVGTEGDFFFYKSEERLSQVTIAGPTFESVNRVHVDRYGKLWVLPYGSVDTAHLSNPPWWLGINSFDGSMWRNYSPSVFPEMGNMGHSTEAFGIAEAVDGSIWFGFGGGSIKRFEQEIGRWSHYCNFGHVEGNGVFIKRYGRCPESDWGKCDAIAQDSSGYMWISSWDNYFGCLICYKPSPDEDNDLTDRYRRFPPYGSEAVQVSISAVAVDPYQNILYGTESGILSVIRYSGDPIATGVIPVKEFPNLLKIYRIIVLENGTSLVLTGSGVYLYDPGDKTLSNMEDFEQAITCLAAENDNLFWYGVKGKGVVRYDFLNNDKTVFNRAQGLISTQVNDLFVDKRNGYVWVATDQGVSRITLGYSSVAGKTAPLVVYPNPFSRRRHDAVLLRNVPRDARVGIYGLNGNLVGTPSLVNKGDGGAFYRWKPSAQCSPGTYFYAIVGPNEKKSGKIMLVP